MSAILKDVLVQLCPGCSREIDAAGPGEETLVDVELVREDELLNHRLPVFYLRLSRGPRKRGATLASSHGSALEQKTA